jgi:hypothetical protein
MFAGNKTRIAALLIWAMIPLTVFASLPRVGCICANGQHKFFCERSRAPATQGLCTCCYGKAARTAVPDRSRDRMARCRQARCSKGLVTIASDRPCRPVLDCSIFVQSHKAAPPDLDRGDHTPLFVTFEPLPMLVSGVAHDFDRGELLPPPDLVTILGVRLI